MMAASQRIVTDVDTPSARAPFVGFATDDVTCGVLSRVAELRGWPTSSVHQGDIAAVAAHLERIATPSSLIVDLSLSPDPLTDIGLVAEVCDPGTRVIALGGVNDVALYRALIDFGVADYLVKPVSSDMIDEALRKAEQRAIVADAGPQATTGGGDDGLGQLVAVVGARGGVGATTVALNTAWTLAHEHGKRVALVDLDLYFGSVALALDLESGRGFREALENPERIDALFIERAMVRASETLFVLAAEEPLETTFDFDPAALISLIDILRKDFDYVVLDLPRFGARTQLPTLSDEGVLCVVSDPTLAGLRDTLRLVRLAKDSHATLRTDIVINGAGASKTGELSGADFEADSGVTISATLPFDSKALNDCAGEGVALANGAKGSPVLAALRGYVASMVGEGPAEENVPIWRRLFVGRR